MADSFLGRLLHMDIVMDALCAACDEVYFEIDLSKMMAEALNSLKYMRMSGDTKLSDLLKPAKLV